MSDCLHNPNEGHAILMADALAMVDAATAALRARVEDLRQAVLRYGWHDGDCAYILDALPCTCGLDAVEDSLK